MRLALIPYLIWNNPCEITRVQFPDASFWLCSTSQVLTWWLVCQFLVYRDVYLVLAPISFLKYFIYGWCLEGCLLRGMYVHVMYNHEPPTFEISLYSFLYLSQTTALLISPVFLLLSCLSALRFSKWSFPALSFHWNPINFVLLNSQVTSFRKHFLVLTQPELKILALT